MKYQAGLARQTYVFKFIKSFVLCKNARNSMQEVVERCSKVDEFEARISGLSLKLINTTIDIHKGILKCPFICSY